MAKGGTVIFAAGSSTAEVIIDPTADDEVEGDETVSLQVLAGADYGVFADGRWYMSRNIQDMFDWLKLRVNDEEKVKKP